MAIKKITHTVEMLNEAVVQGKIKLLNAKYRSMDGLWVFLPLPLILYLILIYSPINCFDAYLFELPIYVLTVLYKIQLCFKIVFLLDTEFVIEFFLFLSGLSVSSSYSVVSMLAYDLLHSSSIISSSFLSSFKVTSNFYFSVSDLSTLSWWLAFANVARDE